MSNFWYYYKRRIKLIGLALMVVLLVVTGYLLYQHYVGKPPLPPDYVAGFEDSDLDSGVVGESEERDIVSQSPAPSESNPSVGDITVDDPASATDKTDGDKGQSNVTDVRWERVGGKNLASLTPFIDWSDGEITEDELDHMYRVVERLEFDKKSDDQTNVICSAPTAEEMSNFSVPILYYVKDGVIILNVKLTVQDLDKEKEKDVFQAVQLKYNLATIEVAN